MHCFEVCTHFAPLALHQLACARLGCSGPARGNDSRRLRGPRARCRSAGCARAASGGPSRGRRGCFSAAGTMSQNEKSGAATPGRLDVRNIARRGGKQRGRRKSGGARGPRALLLEIFGMALRACAALAPQKPPTRSPRARSTRSAVGEAKRPASARGRTQAMPPRDSREGLRRTRDLGKNHAFAVSATATPASGGRGAAQHWRNHKNKACRGARTKSPALKLCERCVPDSGLVLSEL